MDFGEGNDAPLQYSCLENPMDGGAWWAVVHGVAKSRTRLSDFTFTFYFHVLEKEMATHSSVLAWRIPGTGEPGGLPSMGSHRVGYNRSNLAAAAYVYHHGFFVYLFPFSFLPHFFLFILSFRKSFFLRQYIVQLTFPETFPLSFGEYIHYVYYLAFLQYLRLKIFL